MLLPSSFENYKLTIADQTNGAYTNYVFSFTVKAIHYSGYKLKIYFPSAITLPYTFSCVGSAPLK